MLHWHFRHHILHLLKTLIIKCSFIILPCSGRLSSLDRICHLSSFVLAHCILLSICIFASKSHTISLWILWIILLGLIIVLVILVILLLVGIILILIIVPLVVLFVIIGLGVIRIVVITVVSVIVIVLVVRLHL